MKWLTRLKSEKGLSLEVPKLPKAQTQPKEEPPKPPKDPFDSFGSTEERHFPENIALRQGEGDAIESFVYECFSPDDLLEEAFREATIDGWTNDLLYEYIDALREAEALQSPWGFKLQDSPFIGDLWIISDASAREKLPAGVKSITLDELRPIIEACRVFPWSRILSVRI